MVTAEGDEGSKDADEPIYGAGGKWPPAPAVEEVSKWPPAPDVEDVNMEAQRLASQAIQRAAEMDLRER